MQDNLTPYRPTESTKAGIRRQLIKCGVSADSIPHDWLEAIVAATAKWIRETEDGAKSIAKLLEFHTTEGDDSKDYEVYNDDLLTWEKVSADQVLYFQGLMVKNKPCLPDHLHIQKKEEELCEDCGIISHCTKEIDDPYDGKNKSLCNHCMIHGDHHKIVEQGDPSVCDSCPKMTCSHHPMKNVTSIKRA